MNTVVIGTGYLGRIIRTQLARGGTLTPSTYRTKQCFADSIRFDLLDDCLSDRLDLSEIDVIIFTAKPEGAVETGRLLEAMARLYKACRCQRVVYVSSDAVFDGRRGSYTESDSPNPVTDYGRQKLACESLLASMVPNHCIVRTSYLYGYSLATLDERLEVCRRQLEAGEMVQRFDDMFKSPVEVNQMADLIAVLAESDYRGVLHIPGRRMNVHEFMLTAMVAMGVDTGGLVPAHIPRDPPADCLHDTSLRSEVLPQLLPFEPVQIEFALRRDIGSAHAPACMEPAT